MAYDFVGDDDCLEKDEEIDIRGEKYKELIEVCFRYSAYFSFVFREKSIPVSGLERFLVASKITDRWPGTWSGGLHKLSLYSCNKITKSILQSHVNSLFSWVSCWGNGNPEDLAFYRRDKSVFFYMVAHEGMAKFLERPAEDIRAVLSAGGWEKIEARDQFF